MLSFQDGSGMECLWKRGVVTFCWLDWMELEKSQLFYNFQLIRRINWEIRILI